MPTNDIQKLIDNKLKLNVAGWVMDVEDVLTEMNMLSDDDKQLLQKIRHNPIDWHRSFPEDSDTIVARLKRVIKSVEKSSNNQIEEVVMTKENVFIVYSHQNSNIMREIKEFISENLDFEPKILDIDRYAGNIWGAFSENSEECQKAVVIMSADDSVIDVNGNEYKQPRPNVFIELGYMFHKCGLDNVTIVYSTDCEEPSDIRGLISVHYGVDKWTESLRKQLNR